MPKLVKKPEPRKKSDRKPLYAKRDNYLWTKAPAYLFAITFLASCTYLDPNVGRCLSANSLDTSAKKTLFDSGNPILSVDSQLVICTCFQEQERRRRAVSNADSLSSGSSNVSSLVVGGSEEEKVLGSAEKGVLEGDWENEAVTGTGEGGVLRGTDEDGILVGDADSGSLVGASEKENVSGGYESGDLDGNSEGDELDGNWSLTTSLTCRIEPECAGYQLVGHDEQVIEVITKNSPRAVSTSCITW